MKVEVEGYNPDWSSQFELVKKELIKGFSNPVFDIQHIGSTSVKGLKAKPIIDVAVGVSSVRDFDLVVSKLVLKYIYFKLFNCDMPNRRFFVKLKNDQLKTDFMNVYEEGDVVPYEKMQQLKLAHIHVWEKDSSEWIRHIAFRDYLSQNESVCDTYGELKWELSRKEWQSGNAYNAAKNDFIKSVESDAIEWYKKNSLL